MIFGADKFVCAFYILSIDKQQDLPRLPQDTGVPWGNLRIAMVKIATDFFAPPRYTERAKGARILYLDLVLLLNFTVDLLLLLGTNRLTGFPLQLRRCSLGAALGATYAGICILPGLHFLGNTLWRVVCLGGMACVAFGLDKSALRRGVVFVLLSMALGGIALGMGNGGFLPILGAAAGVFLMSRVGLRNRIGSVSCLPVEIQHQGQSVRLTALEDSGNALRDPVTGSSVLVVDGDVAGRLLRLTHEQLLHPVETLASGAVKGLHLVPFRSVGSAGMLLAYRFTDVTVGKKRGSMLVAFAPETIGRGEGYQALTGGAI